MEILIATCWRPDREQRARSVHAAVLASAQELMPADEEKTVSAEDTLVTRLCDLARDGGSPPTDTGGVTAAHVGWLGLWDGSTGRKLGDRELSAAYARSGDAAFQDLYGQYAVVATGVAPGSLSATADHAGFFPLYYAEEPGAVWISSSAMCLARALGRRPRPRAAVALFLTARVRSPDSAFEGIRRLGCGVVLSVNGGIPRLKSTWSPLRGEVAYSDIRECAHHGASILTEVCSSIESGAKPVIDLTGGLDSRLVASCSQRGAGPLQVTVSGGPDDPDVRLAHKICDSLGWDCHHLPIPPPWSPSERWEYFGKAVLLNEGELAGHEGDAPLLGKTELARTFDLSVTGGMGEILRDFFWRQQLTGLGRPELDVERMFRYRFSSRFSTAPLGLFDEGAVDEYLANEIAAATRVANQGGENLPNTAKLDAVYLWKSSGHVGRYLGSSNFALTNVVPIGTRPVLEFALSVPFQYRLRGKLIRHMIASRSTQIAALPTETGGSARPYSPLRPDLYVRHGLDFLTRGMRKARELAVARGQLPAPHVGMTQDREAFRLQMRERGYLDPANLLSAWLYRPEGLEQFLATARRGDISDNAALYALASVELVCRAVA